MAADNPPAGGGIDDVFPTWRKNNIRVCPVASFTDGGGGGATKAKREAAPRRLSSESTALTPQRGTRRASTSRLRRRRAPFLRNAPTPRKRSTPARSQKTCWASTPDVTSSPPVDQEVPTDSHLVPFGFSLDPPSDFSLVDAFVEASPNPPGYGMRSPWDRLTAVSTYGPSGSEEDDEPDFCWDFYGLGNPSAMRDFKTACDYCLSDCSDGSRSFGDEDCGPSRECSHVDLGGPGEGNHLGIPENGDPPRPTPRVDILRELAVVPVPAGGQDSQLEQIREMQARLDEGVGTLEPFRQDIGQEWAGQPSAGEARHPPQGIQHRITDDVRARLPPASSGVDQNLAAAAILLHAMPKPSTTEGRRIQGELKNLLEDAAVRRAESSASRRQGYPSEL
jgi:hypothetical protein